MRQINMLEVIAILKDPSKAIVVDALCLDAFITGYGNDTNKIIEQILLPKGDYATLQNWSKQEILYSANFKFEKDLFDVYYFYDLWREEVYGPQPELAKNIAVCLDLL